MRNTKQLTEETNKVLKLAISQVRTDLSFETINNLNEALDFANRIKKAGSYSCKALKNLSESIFSASVLVKHSEPKLLGRA